MAFILKKTGVKCRITTDGISYLPNLSDLDIIYNSVGDTISFSFENFSHSGIAIAEVTIEGVLITSKTVFDTQIAIVFLEANNSAGGSVCYISTFFRGKSNSPQIDRLFIGASSDGENFECLETSYTPTIGTVRDPSLIVYNGFLWVAHTTGAFGASTSFAVAKWDMKTFLGGRPVFTTVVDVSMAAAQSGVNRVWAPQWFLDVDGLHVIASVSNDGASSLYAAEVYPTNADLTTWSAAVLISSIASMDACIVKLGSIYHAFAAGSGNTVRRLTASSLTGTYTQQQTNILSLTQVEAPEIVLLENGSYRLYVDNYLHAVTYCAESTDLVTWTNVRNINFSIPVPRHVGVIYSSSLSTVGRSIQTEAAKAYKSFNFMKAGVVAPTSTGWNTGTNAPSPLAGRAVRLVAPRDMLIKNVSFFIAGASTVDCAYEIAIWNQGWRKIATTGTAIPPEAGAKINTVGNGLKVRPLTTSLQIKAGAVYYVSFGHGTPASGSTANLMAAIIGTNNGSLGSLIDGPFDSDCYYDGALFYNTPAALTMAQFFALESTSLAYPIGLLE